MARAQLIEGVLAGSAQVVVQAADVNGTAALVYSGNVLLGQSTLTSGRAVVTLSRQLVAGEALLASLGQPGSDCGIPIIVSETGIVINGWRTPTEVSVTNTQTGETLNLTAGQFRELYGYLPPSVQDPAGIDPRLWPEYQPPSDGQLQFDVLLDRSAGSTVVNISSVLGARGGTLVSWNGAAYANALTQTFTTAQTVVVRVKGSDNTEAEAAERSIPISIQPPATGGTGLGSNPDSRIGGVIWRDMSNNYVRAEVNAGADVQIRLSPDASWQDASSYAPQYWEAPFTGIGPGIYNAQVRVSGESDSTKWKLWSFTKQ